MTQILSVKHSGNAGDIIYSLPAIRQLSRLCNNQPVDVYLYLNQPANYYEGAVHNVKNDGKDVMLNEYMLKMLKPLLESLDYIGKVEQWVDQQIVINLDRIRKIPDEYSLMPNGHISRWYFYTTPELTCDLSEQSIPTKGLGEYSEAIVVNRTHRYRNPGIDYSFLNKIETPVYFVGTLAEYDDFIYMVTKAKYLKVTDFLQLSHIISSCKLFIGNQSMCFAIAEQMKTPRLVELCRFAPNVIPTGANGYDFCSQDAFEKLVNKLTQ